MLYTFQARDGSTVERDYEMANAPKIGTRIRVKGKTYRRVLDFGRGVAQIAVEPSSYRHSLWALTKDQAKKYCTVFDEHGHGVARDRAEIQNIQSRMHADGVPMGYDFGLHGSKRGKKL